MKLLQNKKFITLDVLVICIILVVFYSCSATSAYTYPTAEWQITTPEDQGMRSQMLADMMEHISKNSFNIDSILIVRNGYLVFDAYLYPFSKGQKHYIHSCTKSIMSALIGIAIDEGYIQNVDQPVIDFFPDKTIANMDDNKKSITLKNLLTMTSGLKCRDTHLYRWTGLFEMRNSNDWTQYVLDLPMAEPPGGKFEYCNGVSYLLSAIIQNTTTMKALDFAKKNLFDPLAITDVDWETNPQGIDVGYGEMWMKPEDMAKIGLLYLNYGRWRDMQIVPVWWVEESTRGHIDATLFDQYGYQWWVDYRGIYAAVGFKGQFIFIVPEKNIVVVFTSELPYRDFVVPIELLKEYILPAAVSPNALPPNKEEQVRLDALTDSVAKASSNRYTWSSENEGIAIDGVFKRKASPAFRFEYPIGSSRLVLDYPDEVLRMLTPGDMEFTAHVGDIPKGMKLEDFGPIYYTQTLANFGSNLKVISNKKNSLKCGTKAYRTEITWMFDNIVPVTTFLVSVYKDGKYVCLCAHPWKSHYRAEPIVQSLSLK
jgi:CubicO group peptidase (beta-lactamase class C family)